MAQQTKKQKAKVIILTLEKGNEEIYGRVELKDAMIVTSAKTFNALLPKMKNLIKEETSIEHIDFEIRYDMLTFFERFKFLNITKLADELGINSSLMRQYSKGIKSPSVEQTKKIMIQINALGKELQKAKVLA